ncbi:hypothetical protein WMF38_37520 [Sorangium sp. So ce118]
MLLSDLGKLGAPAVTAGASRCLADGGGAVPRAICGGLSVLVLLSSALGAPGCDAAPTEVEPQEPTEVEPQEPTEVEPQEPTEVEPQEPTEVEPQEPTEVEPQEAGAPGPGGATSTPGHTSPAPCALPRGFSEGAPRRFPGFPTTPAPAIGHSLSDAPDADAFGRFLRSTVAFCGPDDQPYFLRYRYYLTGPLSGRWLRPPLAQPL